MARLAYLKKVISVQGNGYGLVLSLESCDINRLPLLSESVLPGSCIALDLIAITVPSQYLTL